MVDWIHFILLRFQSWYQYLQFKTLLLAENAPYRHEFKLVGLKYVFKKICVNKTWEKKFYDP